VAVDPSPTGTGTATKILAGFALLALLWAGYEADQLRRLSAPLQTPTAPRRLISLELSPTTAEASAIVGDWTCRASHRNPCTPVDQVARDALSRDTRFILAYLLLGLLVTAWAARATGASRWFVAATVVAIVGGGVLDLAGNRYLGAVLGDAAALPLDAHALTLARLAAMSKFAVLLVGFAGAAALAGGGLRLVSTRLRIEQQRRKVEHDEELEQGFTSVSGLIDRETAGIFADVPGRPGDQPGYLEHEAADEQFVSFRAADLIGLALSGGGIRSATFNLGVLQGLHRLHLLGLFDYLSTVSGGGYVGSFWSAWLRRQTATPGTEAFEAALFPTVRDEGVRPVSHVDTDQERHLREFSGFLAPRWGFFEVETWTAIVALLAGLVPSLLIGVSVIGVTLIAWLALTFPLASPSKWASATVSGLVTAAVFYLFERMWREFKRESAGLATRGAAEDSFSLAQKRYLAFALLAVAAVVGLQVWLPHLVYDARFEGPWPLYERVLAGAWSQAPADSGIVRWWAVTGIATAAAGSPPWFFSPRLFDYGVVWLLCGLGLVLLRMTYSVWPWSWRRETLAAFDRVLMRVLGMAALWCGIAALWHVVVNLGGLIGVAVGAATSAGVFAALRNWVGVALRRPTEAGAMDRLKPYLPQVLAYLTLGLVAVLVGGLLIELAGSDWWRWWQAAAAMATLLVLALFIKPDEFGLHAFYRERIARAYSGACNLAEGQHAADNRGTEPREHDDPRLSELRPRPLHLVCCAANDLSGDQVETLGRGARSAVLSKYGFSLGRYARPWTWHSTTNRLGSAVTASAAAFNSNMGQISVRVGPAVSFLMTTLNLRLGLWVRHPAAEVAGSRRWPGVLYYREMLALTSASGRVAPGQSPGTMLRDVHLSDGGHFENLALYELVRRHCRYIIVSDCGADRTVAFDDLGNALRRIREDFGVDISLDVAPLRPGADGRSKQHVAVGTIHYSPTDRGILLYVKPTMTGDEPTDVQQYRTRNTAFPHEGTGDQFYDEAQWESYRRLGLHAADSIFKFVARQDSEGRNRTADWVFAEASHQWGPTPEGLEARVLEMTKRFGALEAELQLRQSSGLLAGVFPELQHVPADVKRAWVPAAPAPIAPAAAGAPQAPGAHDADGVLSSELAFLLRATQLMEDVWLTCELDRWWFHDLNLGWINLFARWATSEAFRFWWPLLAPMFSPGFRRFIQERFPMRENQAALSSALANPQQGRVRQVDRPGDGLAATWWQQRSTQPVRWDEPLPASCRRVFYENVLTLPRPAGDVEMQASLAAVTVCDLGAGWTSDDFFVPPSLWGAGIGWYFLEGLLHEVRKHSSRCYVVVKAPREGQRHQVARDDRRSFLEQYRKIGFREDQAHLQDESPLCTAFGYDPELDVILTLDLEQWASAGERRSEA